MAVHCTDLRCERLTDPIGLDATAPRLTWRLDVDAGETDVVQHAHQVEVDGCWDTGRVEGWRQQVTYDGPPIASRDGVRWRVRAWTSAGETAWSPWATFETGILDPGEWTASMITAAASTPVVAFSRTIEVPDDVGRARLRVTGHGVVRMLLDGAEVGDEVLAPGWTSYHHRLSVRTHDVTGLVGPGAVEVVALVAPGWYSGRFGFADAGPIYGAHVGVLAQVELERADGTLEVIGTDDTWTAAATPYREASIYDGEAFDARPPLMGEPAKVALVDGFDHAVLCARAVPPVRRTQELSPVSRDGAIIDFGQNLVGWLRITLRGAAAGTGARCSRPTPPRCTRPASLAHWGGVLGATRDLRPGVGLDRSTGLAWAGGHVGSGVAAANCAGRTLADLITKSESELTRLPWTNHTSPLWDPEPVRWVGVHAVTALARLTDYLDRFRR